MFNFNFFNLCELCRGTRQKSRLIFTVGPVRQQRNPSRGHWPVQYPRPTNCEVAFVFNMTDEQQVPLSIAAADARGNPVPGTSLGSIAWSVDNTQVVTVTPSADGTSAVAAAVGPIGSVTVTVNATLPDGTSATGTFQIGIVPSDATQITITPGTPGPISPPPAPQVQNKKP